jgi:hypothetical protein
MQKLKLKLNAEDLRVESFAAGPAGLAGGTVCGHDATLAADTCGCPPYGTGEQRTIGCWTLPDCTTENNPGTVIAW